MSKKLGISKADKFLDVLVQEIINMPDADVLEGKDPAQLLKQGKEMLAKAKAAADARKIFRDEVLRIARENKFWEDGNGYFVFRHDALVDFAALIAQAEREACAEHCNGAGYGFLADELLARGNS